MNKDRRVTAQVCIELLKECSEFGEMTEASYQALNEAIAVMKAAEYWSLRNQERHAGKNEATDLSIAVSRVALPALEKALAALQAEDYDTVITQLTVATTTDGTAPRRRR